MGKLKYIADADAADWLRKILISRTPLSTEEKVISGRDREAELRPFLTAMTEVLETLARVEIRRTDTYLIGRNTSLLGEVSAVMEITGDLQGRVAVSFPFGLARYLTSRIAWCTPEELTDEEVTDGIGEIINQVSGQARTILHKKGHELQIGLPRVFDKAGEPFQDENSDECYVIIYECSGQKFACQVAIPTLAKATQSI